MAIDCVAFCKALADDTGQRNLGMLLEGARSAGDIVDATDASQPTISYHLNIPKQFGLVISRREGKQQFYAINRNNVVECRGQLMTTVDASEDSEM